MAMEDRMQRIQEILIPEDRRKILLSPADSLETTQYRALANTLLYDGKGILLQACLVASKMEQRLGCLKFEHLLESNVMVRELKS